MSLCDNASAMQTLKMPLGFGHAGGVMGDIGRCANILGGYFPFVTMAYAGAAECVGNFVKDSAVYVGEIVLPDVVFRECYFPARKVAGA